MSRPRIEVRSLRKEYDGQDGTVVAVDDVSCTIESGTVTGILGPNGAGKTTFIKCLVGLMTPSDGAVRIDGFPVHEHPQEAQERAAAMFEGARNVYWRLTPRENLDFFRSLQGPPTAEDYRERREAILASVGLEAKADEPVRSLSRGMQQKVALACVLVRDTPIVFLDEPTLGLDVETQRSLVEDLSALFDDEERTVLLSSHNMDVVEDICDRVVVFRDGDIVAHDDIDAILGGGEGTTFRVEFERPPPAALARRLEERFPRSRWDGDAAVEVGLRDRSRLFEVMSMLEAAGVVPESVGHVEPSLEDVILDLTAESPADPAPSLAAGGDR